MGLKNYLQALQNKVVNEHWGSNPKTLTFCLSNAKVLLKPSFGTPTTI